VPKGLCCAVIDTKNNFSDVAQYARMTVFNLMNDATAPQLEFLGPKISKNIFACTSSLSPATVEAKGREFGINVFVLARYFAGPVARNRKLRWQLQQEAGEAPPLQRLRRELQRAAAAWRPNGDD
jgi:hypothetical protein